MGRRRNPYAPGAGAPPWSVAPSSPITAEHVRVATIHAMADLDASFFRVRFDRLTHAEKNYLRAMATLGPGPHRSGDTAFTVPLFDQFMRRMMP
jgi:hypothetical protein